MAAKEPVWKFGFLRRELVKLVGCCWLARTPRAAVTPSRYTPTGHTLDRDGAPGRGKKEIQ